MSEFGPILVALIAGAASVVATTLSKEQKISEFRQAWIDALRADLAKFLSSAQAFARQIEARSRDGKDSGNPTELPFTQEHLSQIRMTAAESIYRIQLRLNPDEEDHKNLLGMLRSAVSEQNALIEGKGTTHKAIFDSVDMAARFAPRVLKAEWKRVKRGEPPFKWAVRVSAAITAGALIGFIFLWMREQKISERIQDLQKRSITDPVPKEARPLLP